MQAWLEFLVAISVYEAECGAVAVDSTMSEVSYVVVAILVTSLL